MKRETERSLANSRFHGGSLRLNLGRALTIQKRVNHGQKIGVNGMSTADFSRGNSEYQERLAAVMLRP